MEVAAALIAALAVFLVVWISVTVRVRKVDCPVPEDKDLLTMLTPVLRIVALPVQGLIPAGYRRWAQGKLDAAGMRPFMTVEEFFASRLVLFGAGFFATMPYSMSVRIVLLCLAVVFPEIWLLSKVRARHEEIRRTMPYFTDLLAMCTGAGLDFGSAIDRVVARAEKCALSGELKLARRDSALGKSQQEALSNLAHRVQLPELTSFVAIVVQAIRMGATVTGILEAQAEKMRMERYERAERLGTQAQQKILIPLLLLILPAFILLGMVPLMFAMIRPLLEGGLFGGG